MAAKFILNRNCNEAFTVSVTCFDRLRDDHVTTSRAREVDCFTMDLYSSDSRPSLFLFLSFSFLCTRPISTIDTIRILLLMPLRGIGMLALLQIAHFRLVR